MQELLDAFLQALKSSTVRMSEGEVKLFLENYPEELDEAQFKKIKDLTKKRFGREVQREDFKQDEFAGDGTFSLLVPRTGFIYSYLKFTQNLEAPLEFCFFCALSILGQVVGRRQYLERGAYKLYPPTSLILVAPSGVCRKTSAVQLAAKLARQVDVPVLANKITPEDFIRQLQDTHKGGSPLVLAPELAVLIGKQKYNVGLIELLTDLLDCPDHWESGTIMRGRTELKNVTLGLLGASTPKWLKTSIPIEAFAGGLMSRVLLIVKETTPRIFPSPPPLDNETWHDLIFWLKDTQAREGPIKLTRPGSAWFDSWYKQQRKKVDKAKDDNIGYFSRKPDHLLRMAMNLQIARGIPEIDDLSLEEANAIFNWLEDNTPAVIKLLLSTDHGIIATTLIQYLKQHGGHASRTDVLRTLTKTFPPRLVGECLQTLLATQQIGRYDGSPRVGDVFFLKDWSEE
jgi:hypothetical protein